MAVPTPLHYWLIRLRALNRPRLWGAGLGLLLLGLVGHQYLRNPEWLRSFSLDDSDSARLGSAADLADLSPSELANLAEIDNLGLLLNQLQPLTADTLAEMPDPAPITTAALALPSPTDSNQAEPASPFATYLERTRFRLGDTVDSTLPDSSFPIRSRLEAAGAMPPRQSDGPSPSPLQQILNPSPESAPTTDPPEATAAEGTDPRSSTVPTRERLTPNEPTGLTPPPWIVEGQIPGVNQRFIRTTPEMSPPPGTTGYRPPPSLAPAPSGLPTSAPPPGLPPATAPLNLSPGTTSPGGVAPPSGGGNTLPPAGTSPYTPPPAMEAAPFSAPRPPGAHTGGGYIYTFSDPSGPGN